MFYACHSSITTVVVRTSYSHTTTPLLCSFRFSFFFCLNALFFYFEKNLSFSKNVCLRPKKVVEMRSMFNGATLFNSDVSKWQTGKATTTMKGKHVLMNESSTAACVVVLHQFSFIVLLLSYTILHYLFPLFFQYETFQPSFTTADSRVRCAEERGKISKVI